jgi:hypothetical protein
MDDPKPTGDKPFQVNLNIRQNGPVIQAFPADLPETVILQILTSCADADPEVFEDFQALALKAFDASMRSVDPTLTIESFHMETPDPSVRPIPVPGSPQPPMSADAQIETLQTLIQDFARLMLITRDVAKQGRNTNQERTVRAFADTDLYLSNALTSLRLAHRCIRRQNGLT